MHICAIYTHCRQIHYQRSHKGSPRILEWVAYSFSSRSSWPRNRTGVSCIEGEFFTNWAIREAPIYTLLLLLSIYTTMYKIGGGNGTPLQYSCLENPMDGGVWWAAVHGVAKSNTTEWLHFHFSLSCVGEGNSNPLQCSCLENPRDGRTWWAAVYGVAQSRTWLKRLSSSSSRYKIDN